MIALPDSGVVYENSRSPILGSPACSGLGLHTQDIWLGAKAGGAVQQLCCRFNFSAVLKPAMLRSCIRSLPMGFRCGRHAGFDEGLLKVRMYALRPIAMM